MIVSIINTKGGVAKTTSTIYLAAAIHADGRAVAVLDADDQRSSVSWAKNAAARGTPLPFEVQPADFKDLRDTAKRFEASGAVVVVDTPPNFRDMAMIATGIASIAVLPVGTSGVDIDRLIETLAILRQVEGMRGAFPVGVLLTRFDVREKLAKDAVEALQAYPMFDTRIRALARYKSFGDPPIYLEEYAALWEEIKEAVDG